MSNFKEELITEFARLVVLNLWKIDFYLRYFSS